MKVPVSALVALWLLQRPGGARAQDAPPPVPQQEPAPLGEQGPPAGQKAPPQESPGEQVSALAHKGRDLIKHGQAAEGVKTLRAALTLGEKSGLTQDDLASLHYFLGMALAKVDRDDEAVQEMTVAARLSPKDAEVRLDLAAVLKRGDDYDGAIAAARQALALGTLDADDRRDAAALVAAARSERLHSRLIVDGSLSWGYDSNVLQGAAIQTIAGRSTGAAGRVQAANINAAAQKTGVAVAALDTKDYEGSINNFYRCRGAGKTPGSLVPVDCPPVEQWDLPITLNLDVQGRPYGNRALELWVGYHFQQVAMLRYAADAADDPQAIDHDPYNYQEHDLFARLQAVPASWLLLKAKAEGFVNFSGLRDFTPFQGGWNASLDASFIESKRWRTLLNFKNNYRVSFDRGAPRCTSASVPAGCIAVPAAAVPASLNANLVQLVGDTPLDGNKDDLGIFQELRLGWFRGKLGYRFHADQTGVLPTEVPFTVQTTLATALGLQNVTSPTPANLCPQSTGIAPQSGTALVGCFTYFTPLSYLGHEAALYYRFMLPLKFEISGAGRFEHRDYEQQVPGGYPAAYQGMYSATYASVAVPPSPVAGQSTNAHAAAVNATVDALLGNAATATCATCVNAGPLLRRDNLLTLDLAVSKELQRGFTLELSYAFQRDFSNIVNGLDNRSYDKHTALCTAYYAF